MEPKLTPEEIDRREREALARAIRIILSPDWNKREESSETAENRSHSAE